MRYQRLLQLDVVHGYFADPASLQLRFQPDPQTLAWFEATGSVMRGGGATLLVLYDVDPRNGALPAANRATSLVFDVLADDPLFAEYTQVASAPNLRPLRFSGQEAKPDDAGVWRLSEAMGPGAAPRGSASSFRVELPISDDLAEAGRRYRLDFAARALSWKYLLLDDWGEVEPVVVDPSGGVTFKASAAEVLADGKTALGILSETPIALAERPAQRFQLRAAQDGGAPGQVLIATLPAAAPGRLGLDQGSQPPAVVSEIFVAR